MLNVWNGRFLEALKGLALRQRQCFSLDELLVVIWAACGDAAVQLALQKEMAQRVEALQWHGLAVGVRQRAALNALGALWACSFSGCLAEATARRIRGALLRLGGGLDGPLPALPALQRREARPPGPRLPRLVADCGDRAWHRAGAVDR